MKALAGIQEKFLTIGTVVGWQWKDMGFDNDVISFIERGDDGETVKRISFASCKTIFHEGMRLSVSLHDGPSMYNNSMAQVGFWYASALEDGRVRG